MKKHIVFLETEGGSDKEADGLRADTMPMVNALVARGWEAEVILYSDDIQDRIYEYIVEVADAYVSRINPGNLINGEQQYNNMLRALSNAGVIALPHPDLMITYGAKDAIAKLASTELVPSDTYAYYTLDNFVERFPESLAIGARVLKQNRGSVGVGIWKIDLVNRDECLLIHRIPMNAKITCTEASDNHTEIMTLSEFIGRCRAYFSGVNHCLLDMPYLHRIAEGEMRVLMVGLEPLYIVHKKPELGDNIFSATLYSGATYRYDKPEDWSELSKLVQSNLPMVFNQLGNLGIPLLWSMDFILDWDEDHNDTYVLSEINCSCVGFTSHLHLDIQDRVADKIIEIVNEQYNQLEAA